MTPYLKAAKTLPLALIIGIAFAYLPLTYVLAGLIGFICICVIVINPILGMYLLSFFLPFERIGSLDIAGVTIRLSQVIAIITILAWLMYGLVLSKFKLRPYPILLPIAGFILVMCAGITNSPNLDRSLLVLGYILFTMCVSIILPSIIRHTDQVKRVIYILLGSMFVVCSFGIWQFLGDIVGLPTSLTGLRPQYTKEILGFPRIQSTALEPLYFANYLLIPLSLAIALWLSKSSKIKPWWLFALIALGGINFILTVSRGGYIALAATLLCLAIAYWKQLLKPTIIIPLIISVAIAGGVAYQFLGLTEQVNTFTEHVMNIFGGASYSERVETFDIAERIWWQHPWVGIGPGSFGPYASYHPYIVPSDGYKIVNNEYIELLAETGVLGLACYIIMMIMLYIRSVKALLHGTDPFMRHVLIALLAALTGILVQYNTFSVLYIMHIWFLIGLMVTVQNILLHGDHQ
ncbi:MAG: O-antigen ligase family protein [Patescibacteria group bacterium]|jgi:O-antigen ligase